MSSYWQKSDKKCYNCKEDLPVGQSLVKVLWMELDPGYICPNCGETNAWQDENASKFSRFIFWLGRKYW